MTKYPTLYSRATQAHRVCYFALGSFILGGCQLNITAGSGGSVHAGSEGGDTCNPCTQDMTEANSSSYHAVADAGFEFSGWDGTGYPFCTEARGKVCTLETVADTGIEALDNFVFAVNATFSPESISGLWLAQWNTQTEGSFDDTADGDNKGNFSVTGIFHYVFQITENDDGGLAFRGCAGDSPTQASGRWPEFTVALSDGGNTVTLPAGYRISDAYGVNAETTVTLSAFDTLIFPTVATLEGDIEEMDENGPITTMTPISMTKIGKNVSAPIGTFSVGDNAQDVYCFRYQTFDYSQTNITNANGNSVADISGFVEELRAESALGDEVYFESVTDKNTAAVTGMSRFSNFLEGEEVEGSTATVSIEGARYSGATILSVNGVDVDASLTIELD